jgi:hypothetical protein
MSSKRLFHCADCGGDVVLAVGPGRTAPHRRGVELPVPADFAIPTCALCGETYLTAGESARLAELQRPAFDQHLKRQAAKLVELLTARHRIPIRRLEAACGVTATYLSHVTSGDKVPSVQLVRLLEAFHAAPDELERHLAGRPWQASTSAELVARAPSPPPTVSIVGGEARVAIERPRTYAAPKLGLPSAANDNQTAA